MQNGKQASSDPETDSAGIPDAAKERIEARIRAVAEKQFAGRYANLDIRFHGQFCYIDALIDPDDVGPDWPSANWPESRENHLERMRSTPIHLCRLSYTGNEDAWEFAFYTQGSNTYEPSQFPTGEPLGTPEDAFLVSAGVYLTGG